MVTFYFVYYVGLQNQVLLVLNVKENILVNKIVLKDKVHVFMVHVLRNAADWVV